MPNLLKHNNAIIKSVAQIYLGVEYFDIQMPDLIEVLTSVCQQVALCVGPSGEAQVWAIL